MKAYLEWFLEKFDYPGEARKVLNGALDAMCTAQGRFEEILKRYKDDINCDMNRMMDDIAALSQDTGVNEYTGKLLLFICMSETLREYYRAEGIDEEIWTTSMFDLKYKLIECRLVHGVWGSFVAGWFVGFFRLTRFGFGKLQFELIPFGRHYRREGLKLLPESNVVNIHIPRTGGRLDGESLKTSYDLAAAFFKKRYGLKQVVFNCNSWLLFPRNLEALSKESNLRRFITGFEIIRSGEYADYSQVWRLFDKEYEGDVDQLPQDTSFRRAYADWIRRGEKTGWAHGVFVYGE